MDFSSVKKSSKGRLSQKLREKDSYCVNPKKYILVVEDDCIITEIICEAVGRFLPCEVLTANLGADALELFKTHSDQTICIILDYAMPDMHSSRIIAQLREINTNTKVILSSGYPENVIFNDFPTELVDRFLPKPYSPLKLVSVIRGLTEETVQ